MAKKIAQFFLRDKTTFTALSKCGHLTIEQMKSCGLADSRIKAYVREKLVEKVHYKVGNEVREAYKMTSKGRSLAKNEWNLQKHYKAQNPTHDTALATKYFSLSTEEQQSWKTESQIYEEVFQKIQEMRQQGDGVTATLYEKMLKDGQFSMPDGVFVQNGIEVAFEILTDKYGRKEMIAKEATVQLMNYNYQPQKI